MMTIKLIITTVISSRSATVTRLTQTFAFWAICLLADPAETTYRNGIHNHPPVGTSQQYYNPDRNLFEEKGFCPVFFPPFPNSIHPASIRSPK